MSDKSDNESRGKSDSDDIFIKVDSKPAKKLSKTKAKTEEQKNRIAEILAAGRAKRAEKLKKAKSEKISSSMTEAEIRKLIQKINNETAGGATSPREEPAKQEPAKQEPAKQEPAKQEPAKQEPVKEPVIDTQAEAHAKELRKTIELASELRRKNAAKMKLLYGNRFG